MRTAAMLHEAPDAILADLNAALRVHDEAQMQTCTAVYGQIDMAAQGAAVTLAVAGHPPPLVVRADGDIEVARAHGTMLGAVDDPTFVVCQVSLAAGDAIVICSDGFHDTTLDGIRVDEERVAELLSGPSRASAGDLVDRLTGALRDVDRTLALPCAPMPAVRVLFVCMGNICRSPTAEGVMRALVAAAGLRDRIELDSAGTGGWHEGAPPDARATAAATLRGIELEGAARQVRRRDFEEFDLLIALDAPNARDLRRLAPDADAAAKVRRLREFDPVGGDDLDVGDPYYGGEDGFGRVLDQVQAACDGLLEELRTRAGAA